jgi:hypothetical protein
MATPSLRLGRALVAGKKAGRRPEPPCPEGRRLRPFGLRSLARTSMPPKLLVYAVSATMPGPPRGRQKFEINSEGNEASRVSQLGCALKWAEPPQFSRHLCADALHTPQLLVADAPQIAERSYGSRLSVLEMPEASGPTLDVRVA